MLHAHCAKVLLGCALLSPLMVKAASFDCALAKTRIEQIICSDSELSRADTELEAKYRQARAKSKSLAKILADQRKWLRERNACKDKGCLYAHYQSRLMALAIESGDTASMIPGPPWIFELTQGADSAVCRAYLRRLNEGDQANYPFCDRPETGEDMGFVLLQRKPLTNDQLHDLAQRAHGFMYSRDQDAVELANASRRKLGLRPQDRLTQKNIADYVNKDIFVWQYDPLVDIDNDGRPDRLVVWRGYPVGGGLPGCGWTDKWSVVQGVTQMPFFVDEALTRIDEKRTESIFGHPSGGYKIFEGTEAEKVVKQFRPIGTSIGIFKYQETYYFDTFFNSWGDFKGLRRTYPWINSVLGVFVRKHGRTEQVCEYRWTNNPNDQISR